MEILYNKGKNIPKEDCPVTYYVVDAFTARPFAGNPAGVCLVDAWPAEEKMQQIAGENNLPETAFICKEETGWRIRWFTPAFEMDLCGHATLASGFVILTQLEPGADYVDFASCSGPLRVLRQGDRFTLDFPSRPPVPVVTPEGLAECLGVPVLGCFQSRDLIVLVEDAAQVASLQPDFAAMARIIPAEGVVPTAPGEDCDFVSRFFDPHDAIIEDPVTGSAHCTLVPFWADRLGKDTLVARQLSKRGGTLFCENAGQRVFISGNAVLYSVGEIKV